MTRAGSTFDDRPMQPLPPSITTQTLFDAAAGYQRAASLLGTAEGAVALREAASSTYQGVPSLLMTTMRDSGSRELAAQLRDAAAAAMTLATEIAAAPEGSDFSAHKDAILGWSRIAADAASLVAPAAGFGF